MKDAFVGRAEQREVLTEKVARAAEGEPAVVLVEGPPGIGKTALVHRVLRGTGGLRILDAAADAAETDVAWGVIDQLARAIGRGAADELAAMTSIADASAVGGWLLGHLGELDADGPIALVVDDLPWSDSLSIAALAFALRRLRSDRVLAVFTARSSDVDQLPQGVHQLLRGPNGTVVRLAGLDADEVRQLGGSLGVDLADPVVARLTEQTEGNPLHLTTLLSEVPVESLASAGDRPLPAPASFRSLVLGRLATSTPETERLVVATSALGMRAPLADAAAVAGLDDPLAAVDEAVAKDLLSHSVGPTGAVVAFTHPMVRSAVYNDLGPVRRAEVHRAAADVSPDTWSRLRHLVDAAIGPDAELVGELSAFADARRGTGPAGAADAGAAFRLAARVAAGPEQADDLRLRALECLLAVGDAAGVAELAGLTAGAEDSPRHRYVRGALMSIRSTTAEDMVAAVALLTSAWDEAGETDDPSMRAGIATQIATIELNQLHFEEVDRWTERALATGGISLLSEPTVASALARSAQGRTAEALGLMPPVPEDGFDLFAIPRALGGGVAALWNEDPAEARARLTDAYEASRAFGVFFVATLSLVYLSDAEMRLGLLDDALHHALLAASTSDDADQAWFRSLCHGNAAAILALRGDRTSAAEHAAEARSGEFTPAYVVWAEHAAALVAHLGGDVEGARAAIATLESDPAYDHGVVAIKPWHLLAAEVHVAAGELDAAERLLDRVAGEVDAFPRPILTVGLWRVRAALLLARGDTDGALAAFERAVAAASDCPSPLESALAHLDLGAHLRRAGQRSEAAEHLRTAVETLGRIGAGAHLARAERELAACGLTPAKRSTATGDELTPQERTVALLATRGLRNKEIAAELVVSPKTIEYHLGNAYRKLGVSNRAQLVAAFSGD